MLGLWGLRASGFGVSGFGICFVGREGLRKKYHNYTVWFGYASLLSVLNCVSYCVVELICFD